MKFTHIVCAKAEVLLYLHVIKLFIDVSPFYTVLLKFNTFIR